MKRKKKNSDVDDPVVLQTLQVFSISVSWKSEMSNSSFVEFEILEGKLIEFLSFDQASVVVYLNLWMLVMITLEIKNQFVFFFSKKNLHVSYDRKVL